MGKETLATGKFYAKRLEEWIKEGMRLTEDGSPYLARDN